MSDEAWAARARSLSSAPLGAEFSRNLHAQIMGSIEARPAGAARRAPLFGLPLAAAATLAGLGLAISLLAVYRHGSGEVRPVAEARPLEAPVASPVLVAEPILAPETAPAAVKHNVPAPVFQAAAARIPAEVPLMVTFERTPDRKVLTVLRWDGAPRERYRVTCSDAPDVERARFLEWFEVEGNRWSDGAAREGVRYYRVERLNDVS